MTPSTRWSAVTSRLQCGSSESWPRVETPSRSSPLAICTKTAKACRRATHRRRATRRLCIGIARPPTNRTTRGSLTSACCTLTASHKTPFLVAELGADVVAVHAAHLRCRRRAGTAPHFRADQGRSRRRQGSRPGSRQSSLERSARAADRRQEGPTPTLSLKWSRRSSARSQGAGATTLPRPGRCSRRARRPHAAGQGVVGADSLERPSAHRGAGMTR